MKSRVTLTIDPAIAVRAKRIAHSRKTSVSALIEDLIRNTPLKGNIHEPFVEKWAGKFQVRKSAGHDARLDQLKKKYGLD